MPSPTERTDPGEEPESEVAPDEAEAEADQPVADETPQERLAREAAEYLANWRRARADYQNLRRRQREDIDLAISRAREVLFSELLLVLDTMDMALGTECTGEEGKNLLLGVRMTRDQLMALLERDGVSAVPDGGTFDPAIHQAVETVPAGDRPAGEVVETVRTGYRMGDGVLRHAQVKVSAADEPPEADGADDEGDDGGLEAPAAAEDEGARA
ncbi:MAG: nucleotide exchange factor GrpE [Planctomycetota bacterium]|jgi:molecular chaperone GrpE|nr:nucleotide exchange factor GrpE [Planctomycetota bacterium]MDP6762612.1 nucleotide exchange factor GrpE [Planctomycetota bacterium]